MLNCVSLNASGPNRICVGPMLYLYSALHLSRQLISRRQGSHQALIDKSRMHPNPNTVPAFKSTFKVNPGMDSNTNRTHEKQQKVNLAELYHICNVYRFGKLENSIIMRAPSKHMSTLYMLLTVSRNPCLFRNWRYSLIFSCFFGNE
jgi:hypothetical protein